ncbi:MAG: hypothetical protein HZB43_07405 [candidate division Zixibacteria bacterium]|nr:hypothetical protein [candidate division Zixibacteria bacterium]
MPVAPRFAAVVHLGPPVGEFVRSQYDIGRGGSVFGGQKALILEYNPGDTVVASHVTP